MFLTLTLLHFLSFGSRVDAVASRSEKFSRCAAELSNVCLLLCNEFPPRIRDPVAWLWPLAL